MLRAAAFVPTACPIALPRTHVPMRSGPNYRGALVPEVAAGCEDHCHAGLVAGVDRCLVVLRSAGLDHCLYPGLECQLGAVREWEECVACHDRVVELELRGARLLDRDPD